MNTIANIWRNAFMSIRSKIVAFFANRGLFRLRTDKLAGGVCSGCAKRLGLHPGLLRFYLMAVCIFVPPIVIVYGVLWLLMPLEADK